MDAGDLACGLLDAELALDRLEAEVAAELPAHVRAFALAYAAGRDEPAAPASTMRPASLAIALRAARHAELADRAAPLVRLLAPLAIDADPVVAAALRHTPRDWAALAALTRARDAITLSLFRLRYVELVHALHGSTDAATSTSEVPPPIGAWFEPGEPVDIAEVEALWQRFGVRGRCRVIAAARDVPPRAFVVEPGREVIVVVPRRIAAPSERFATVHELGHAIAALVVDRPLPRVVDEAAAAYVARLVEPGGAPTWTSELAIAARERRRLLAGRLDRTERALPDLAELPTPDVPWALWHDSGAQAAYVAAEDLADRFRRELGPWPDGDAFARVLRAAASTFDQRFALA